MAQHYSKHIFILETQTGVEELSQIMGITKRSSYQPRRSYRSSKGPRSRFNPRKAGLTNRAGNRVTLWPYQRSGMSLMWDPFPAKATARLRYSTTIVLDPGAAVPAAYLFRANSIHDPDFSGIGHQPYGHDTYQSIYNHYNVRSSTITITPTKPRNGIYGVTLTDDSTVQSDYDTIREVKGTKYAVCSDNGSPQSTVTQYYNCNQNFDIPFQKATSATFGNSPSEGMYFHVWAESVLSTEDGSQNSFVVNISFVVDMWELKDLGQS